MVVASSSRTAAMPMKIREEISMAVVLLEYNFKPWGVYLVKGILRLRLFFAQDDRTCCSITECWRGEGFGLPSGASSYESRAVGPFRLSRQLPALLPLLAGRRGLA